MKRIWTFVLLQLTTVAFSLKFLIHPEAHLNMEQKIRNRGYPLEIHEVTTEDNYILTLLRVPYGRGPRNNKTRSPVLLLHGMGAQPEYFLALGNHSLVYYLADRDFDVWILNNRGSVYSKKHKYYDIEKDRRYWQFSFHEIGVYDIPVNIDYIVNKTNQKVFVIGHSQGNTCYFVMAAERPEYNEKVKISAVYAPSIMVHYMDYPFATLFSNLVAVFEVVYNILGMTVVFPINDTLADLVKLMCSETTFYMKICMNVISIIGSHESKLITKETVALVGSIPPVTISARQLFHYMQNVRDGSFRQYNFGEKINLKKYKSRRPPEYNLTNAVAPVALFYGENDDLTTVKGAHAIMKLLPNVIFDYKVPYKYFNHVDFLFGKNSSTLVYKKTVEVFKQFDSGKMRKRKRQK